MINKEFIIKYGHYSVNIAYHLNDTLFKLLKITPFNKYSELDRMLISYNYKPNRIINEWKGADV